MYRVKEHDSHGTLMRVLEAFARIYPNDEYQFYTDVCHQQSASV